MWVEWEDGADLSQSQKKPGNYSPLTRDGEKKLGQVTLSDIDGDEVHTSTDPKPLYMIVTDDEASARESRERAELEALLGALMALGVLIAVEKAKPHVTSWWNGKAVPALKSARNRLARSRRGGRLGATSGSSTPIESAPTESSQENTAVAEECQYSMSSAEARERFVSALAARLSSDEQLGILRNSRIEDEDGRLESGSAAEVLTARQVVESVALRLEANPSSIDKRMLEELEKILEGSRADGEYIAPGIGESRGAGVENQNPGIEQRDASAAVKKDISIRPRSV